MCTSKQLQRILFIATIFITSLGCAQDKNLDESNLYGCWTSSYEESKLQSDEVYRPCDYQVFPPSRFRFSMELQEGGACRYLYLAPNDAHEMVNGTWTLNTNNGTLTILNDNGQPHIVLIVNAIQQDQLLLKKAE